MITSRKIEIFKKFCGNIDYFIRVGTHQEKKDIADKDWLLIDSLLQDLELVDKGLAASTFAERLNKRLLDSCENDEVLQALKRLNKDDFFRLR